MSHIQCIVKPPFYHGRPRAFSSMQPFLQKLKVYTVVQEVKKKSLVNAGLRARLFPPKIIALESRQTARVRRKHGGRSFPASHPGLLSLIYVTQRRVHAQMNYNGGVLLFTLRRVYASRSSFASCLSGV